MDKNKTLVLLLLAFVSQSVISDPINVGPGIQNRWKKSYETFPGCGLMPSKEDIAGTITGGVPVTPDDPFPWMVYICIMENLDGSCMLCGGSMITDRKVLTAAHCVEKSTPDNTGLIIGVHNTTKKKKKFAFNFISKIDIYPGYNLTKGKTKWTKLKNAPDIAILTLENPVPLNDKINTLCLTDGLSHYVGQSAIVSGWGYDPLTNKTSDDKLMKVDITMISNVECKKRSRPRYSFLQR